MLFCVGTDLGEVSDPSETIYIKVDIDQQKAHTATTPVIEGLSFSPPLAESL